MVVGDDDQAIYKFQGAEISNIIDFKSYRDPAIVMFKENYRSTQTSWRVALYHQKEPASLSILPDIEKELVAANKEIRTERFTQRILRATLYHWLPAKLAIL